MSQQGFGEVRRYRVTHRTTLDYGGRVKASHNELRMTPISESRQTTMENRIKVRPMTWSQVYRDAWGTHVMVVEASAEHTNLQVESTSTVELNSRPVDDVEESSWQRLAMPAVGDRFYEFLAPSRLATVDETILAAFASARAETPLASVQAVADEVRRRLRYQSGVTEVKSSAAEAWASGRGVCQDFAHLTIGVLRQFGIPARYVSGYLVPTPDAAIGDTHTGESHAWVEAWVGYWHPLDPTNGRPVALDHIVVARGRDYSDVPPFKGIYSGPRGAGQQVAVEFTRLG